MVYILNGISVSMFDEFPVTLEINEIDIDTVFNIINKEGSHNVVAIINRKNIAQHIANVLDVAVNVSYQKAYPKLSDEIIIARYVEKEKEPESSDKSVVNPSKNKIRFFLVSRYR